MEKMKQFLKRIKTLFGKSAKWLNDVNATKTETQFKCVKCGAEVIVPQGYGSLRVLCKCGHAKNVYTGQDYHFKSDRKKVEERRSSPLSKEERESIDEQRRVEVFYKHIASDLTFLCNMVNSNRDITKQVRYKECIKLLDGVEKKDGYEKITKYLQEFCDLKSVPLNIVWEPLSNSNTLSSLKKETNIMGTTYFLEIIRDTSYIFIS